MPLGFICDPQTGGCGWISAQTERWYGPCPGCDGLYACKQTIIDSEREPGDSEGEVVHGHGVRELSSVKAVNLARTPMGFTGLDRVLGQDAVTKICGLAISAGHTIQIYGAPGCGKSTLLTQACGHLTRIESKRVLYVAGEESTEQIKARADRTGVKFSRSRMLITEDTDLDRLFYAIQDLQPEVCIVDSLQKVRVEEYALGSLQAAIIATNDLYRLATKRGMALILVNQMNKAGDDFAGAKAVEHAVDTQLFLRMHRDKVRRVLECTGKNRHGITPMYQTFEMTDRGLVELEGDNENEQVDDALPETRPRRSARLRGH